MVHDVYHVFPILPPSHVEIKLGGFGLLFFLELSVLEWFLAWRFKHLRHVQIFKGVVIFEECMKNMYQIGE